jgi:hypothetical protein
MLSQDSSAPEKRSKGLADGGADDNSRLRLEGEKA